MDIKPTLRARGKNKELLMGTWCIIPSEHVISVIAKAGLDFVLIDMEHGSADYQNIARMIMAANAEGCEAVVRVSVNDESQILKALDLGASGIIVPHIESVTDRQKALSFMKYPPVGIRGYSPYTRAGGYSVRKDHAVHANEGIMSGIIIESMAAVENLEDIIDDPELDIVYLGAYDLSVSLGIPGDVRNEKIIKIIEDCTKKILAHGKIAGGLFNSEEDLDFFKSIGIRFACYGVDTSILYKGFNSMFQKK